jgi:murein DD-endopeptidase MepM/ murein hydrolase activator NlpD
MAFQIKTLREKVKAHLKRRFLLIIREEDTFEEVETYRLTLLNVYLLLSTVFVISGSILLLLIILTPLKTYIPGYGNVRYTGEFIRLENKIEAMQKELKAREVYIENFQRLLDNNPKTTADVTRDITISQEIASPVPRVKEDSLLRENYQISARKSEAAPVRSSTPRQMASLAPQIQDLSELKFSPPLRGTLGAAFSPDKEHFGLDIIAPENTPIRAVLPGVVIQSDWTLENGHTIAIQHANNILSVYKHNSALLKRTGTQVKSGEAIAIIGNTGTLTKGPHLHFELWHLGIPLNPSDYIRF